MRKLLLLSILLIACLSSCDKDDMDIPGYYYTYKLSGKYYRDSTNNSNGYKMLDLRDDGSYCWIRRNNNKDSLYCYGSYVQTSDTSMLWNDKDLIIYKATKIDSIPNGLQLNIEGFPAVAPLYGYYK